VGRHIDKLGRVLSTLTRPLTTLHHLRSAFSTMRELAKARAPTMSLDRVVGLNRNLAVIRASLDQVTEIAHSYDAKINDVLLAIIAGGLQGLLRSRGEPIEDLMLPVYVPATLRTGSAAGCEETSSARWSYRFLSGYPIQVGGFDRSRPRPPSEKRKPIHR